MKKLLPVVTAVLAVLSSTASASACCPPCRGHGGNRPSVPVVSAPEAEGGTTQNDDDSDLDQLLHKRTARSRAARQPAASFKRVMVIRRVQGRVTVQQVLIRVR